MTTRTIAMGACLLLACGGASTVPETTARPAATATAPAPAMAELTPEQGLLPPMPTAVTSFGAAILGEHLYVLGGYHGTPHDYSREGQSPALSRVSLSGEGTWETIDELDVGLQGHALVEHDGLLCRFGGNRIHNAAGAPTDMRSIDEAACYSTSTRAWTALPALPAGRSSHQATVIGEDVYLAGGWRLGDGGPGQAEWADDVLALDLHGGAWRAIEAPFRRRAVGVAAAAGSLVVVGGLTPEREVSRRVDVLDPTTGAWTEGPDFPADAFGVAAVGIGDAVYASARDGALYRWRVGTPAWEPVAQLAFGRFFHQLVAPDASTVIAVGGIGGMHTEGRTRHVERVAIDASAPRVVSWSMSYPGRAKNRQAAFVHEDTLYLFGGNDSLEQHDFEPENFVSEGWRLHLASGTWAPAPDYPHRRQSMQALVVDGRGIALGGFGHDGTVAVSHPEGYAFDFSAGTWTPRGGLPDGRTQLGVVAHEARLFAFGGLRYDPRRGAEAFDHVTSVLATPAEAPDAPLEGTELALPGPRRAFAGASLDGRYYLVGGMREDFQLVDDCFAFDFATSAFEPIACPRRTRLSGHLVPVAGRLYLVGGSVRGASGMEADRSIEVYDPRADTWEVALAELPFETRHMHALVYEDRGLLLVSTHDESRRARVAIVLPEP